MKACELGSILGKDWDENCGKRYRAVTTFMSDFEIDRLDDICRINGWSRSNAIRELVRMYFTAGKE